MLIGFSFGLLAGATITISDPPRKIKMGDYPEFSFSITDAGTTNLTLEAFLLKDGEPVGQITWGEISFPVVSSNLVKGTFSWGITRMIDYHSERVVWPEPAEYTIRLGVFSTFARPKVKASKAEYLATAETPVFELTGSPPPLIIHRYSKSPYLHVYSSGKPGEHYTLLWSYTPDFRWTHEFNSFFIDSDGVILTLVNVEGGRHGFFILRHNQERESAPKP